MAVRVYRNCKGPILRISPTSLLELHVKGDIPISVRVWLDTCFATALAKQRLKPRATLAPRTHPSAKVQAEDPAGQGARQEAATRLGDRIKAHFLTRGALT